MLPCGHIDAGGLGCSGGIWTQGPSCRVLAPNCFRTSIPQGFAGFGVPPRRRRPP